MVCASAVSTPPPPAQTSLCFMRFFTDHVTLHGDSQTPHACHFVRRASFDRNRHIMSDGSPGIKCLQKRQSKFHHVAGGMLQTLQHPTHAFLHATGCETLPTCLARQEVIIRNLSSAWASQPHEKAGLPISACAPVCSWTKNLPCAHTLPS